VGVVDYPQHRCDDIIVGVPVGLAGPGCWWVTWVGKIWAPPVSAENFEGAGLYFWFLAFFWMFVLFFRERT
jgi:hypothetical protein